MSFFEVCPRFVKKIEHASYIFGEIRKLFLARMTTPNVKFRHFEILLWILSRFYPRETMCRIRGKLLPLPTSFGDSSDSVLSGPQSVSCQYAASRTYSQRTRVCDPAYVAHVERVVSATRFGDSPVSSVYSLRDYSVCQVHQITSPRLGPKVYKPYFVRGSPTRSEQFDQVIECRRGSSEIRSQASQTSVHKSLLSTFMFRYFIILLYCSLTLFLRPLINDIRWNQNETQRNKSTSMVLRKLYLRYIIINCILSRLSTISRNVCRKNFNKCTFQSYVK